MPKRTRAEMKAAKSGPAPLRRECFIETTDDWYPNFDAEGKPDRNGQHVRLVMCEFVDHSGYRVAVWGADDTGMERDFEGMELPSALELFARLKGGGSVCRADLSLLGMVPA